MMRLRTSRPRLSVPNTCAPSSGGCNRSRRAWAVGLNGDSASAPTAPSVTSRITIRPIVAVNGGGRRARCRTGDEAAICLGTVWAPSADSAAKTNPWIESGIEQIDDDVHDDHPGRGDRNERLDDRHVAGGDRFNGQPAHAG